MPRKEKTTYISIPPPPLPEFYMTKQKSTETSSSSSGSSTSTTQADAQAIVLKTKPSSGDGTYDAKPRGSRLAHPPVAPLVAMPPAMGASCNDVPPLAIYHICRICLRPRSPRYHREHPIPVGGVPPPPGICRRCRVTPVEEKEKMVEIVTKSRSDDIKIGMITPFIPDEDIVSNEEMRRMKFEKYFRGRSCDRKASRHRGKSRRNIFYRHVRVIDEPEETKPRRTKAVFTAQNAVNNSNDESSPEPPKARKTITTSLHVQPTEKRSSPPAQTVKDTTIRQVDSAKASVSTQASSGSASTAKASAKVTTNTQQSHMEADIRKIAREEIEEYGKNFQEPERSESDVRRISREEVERYREAERKLEAHPDPYAHGRLIPVERRIAAQTDVPEPAPWSQSSKQNRRQEPVEVKSQNLSARPVSVSQAESQHQGDRLSVSQKESQSKMRKSRTREQSWGPRWRRELSAERHRSSPPGLSDAKAESKKQKPETKRDSACPTPKTVEPAKEESYVVEMVRRPAERRYDHSDVVDELDLPPRTRPASYRRPETVQRAPTSQSAMKSNSTKAFEPDIATKEARGQNQSARNQPGSKTGDASSKSSKPTGREYWYDDATVRTVETRSSKRYQATGNGGTPQQYNSKEPPPGVKESETGPHQDPPSPHHNKSSEVTFWPNDRPRDLKKSHRPSEGILPYPAQNRIPERREPLWRSDKDRPSKDTATKSNKSSREPNSEYLYTERIIKPADWPADWTPSDRGPPDRVVVVEETEWFRTPKDSDPPSERRRERHQRNARDSEESNHVRFKNKVEVSPTPPDSDASSSAFRSFHSIGRGNNSRQLDGQQGPEREEDLMAEYERRGRTRSRDVRRGRSYEQDSYREQEYARDSTVRPKQKENGGSKSSKPNSWVKGARQLERALSESPSRESLNGDRQTTW